MRTEEMVKVIFNWIIAHPVRTSFTIGCQLITASFIILCFIESLSFIGALGTTFFLLGIDIVVSGIALFFDGNGVGLDILP